MQEPPEKIVRLAKQSLKRVLGTKELFAVGYGDVGSSIYYALGVTALYALGATPIAFLIAGLVFICTALTYAELATTFPEPGGSATFTRHAFNDLISFIAGWALLLDYVITLAISAFTVPPYIKEFLNVFGVHYDPSTTINISFTICIIAALFLLNTIGIKYSGWFSFLLAALTLVTQAGIVIFGGLFFLNLPHVIDQMRIGVENASWSPDWWMFLKGTAMAMVAYTGIEAISQLAAETKNPAVSIPRSIKWTIATVLFFFLGTTVVGFSVVSPESLGTVYLDHPVEGIVANFPIGGKLLSPWVGLIAAIILLIAANAGLIGCSRLTFSMGEFYQVPNVLFYLHKRFRTPCVSLAVFSGIAAFIVILSRGRMLFLADLYNFGAQIAFFSAHIALIVLRIKKPSIDRPYRAPLNIPITKFCSIPLTALIGATASFLVWLLVVSTKPEGTVIGFSWLALGIAMYLFYRKRKKIGATAQLQVEEVAIPEYKPMQPKHILVAARTEGGIDALETAYQLAQKHRAKTKAVFVLEIPHSMPLDANMGEQEELGKEALKRAEAIAREYHLSIDLELVRSRSATDTLIRMAEEGSFDLIVASSSAEEAESFAEQLIKNAVCKVIFCKS